MKLWNVFKQDHSRKRHSRAENGVVVGQGDESDSELRRLSAQDSPEHTRPKSAPVDLLLHGSLDNDDLSMRNETPSPVETTMSPPRRIDAATNGHGRMSPSPVARGSQNSGRQSPSSRPQTLSNSPRFGGDKSLNTSQNKKRSNNWFSLSYKQKSDEFHKIFKDIPAEERLLVDYSCAMQKDLLVHGKLYVTQNWICFYANILFKWETVLAIPCKEIKSITKEKTARVIPNAIQINTLNEKYFFSSFTSRDKTYLMMFRIWQNVLMEHPMSNQKLWQWVHHLYGSQLGLTASDDDYEVPDSTHESDTAQTPDVSSIAGSEEAVPAVAMITTNGMLPRSGAIEVITEVPHHDVSSDCTDTSEEACDEVECPDGHEHSNWVTMDLIVNFTADQVFDLLFTDTPFIRGFLDSRNTTDINLGQWSEEPDSDGVKHRTNSFTIAINASFGPKSTPSIEKQKLQKESKPGSYYCVDCETLNDPSLPYGENFYVWNRYCISRLTKQTSRVQVHSKICYKKSVFSLAKTIIEKNVRSGVNSYYKPLCEALAQESENNPIANVDQPRKKKRYTRHRSVTSRPANGAIPGAKPSTTTQPSTDYDTSRRNAYITSTVRVMSALLIFLVMFNMLLFFKLWTLETRHTAVQYDQDASDVYSHHELVELLNKQRYLYEKDIQHWQSALESSADMIQKLQHSIEEIKLQQEKLSAGHINQAEPVEKPPLSAAPQKKIDL